MEQLTQIWSIIVNIASNIRLKDFVDIIVIALLIYSGLKLIRDTRAGQLVKGFLFLVVVQLVAAYFDMVMLNAILSQIFTFAVLALLILFQPEIRKALEQMGRNRMDRTLSWLFTDRSRSGEALRLTRIIDEIVEGVVKLQALRMGALMVFEQQTRLDEIVATGTTLQARVSAQLLGNIFYNKAPLHDGAVILREGNVLAAGCILPLTARSNINAALGTRHRAALGISEDSDAIALVVSEETGQISLAQNGVLTRNLTAASLREALQRLLIPETPAEIAGQRFPWHKASRTRKRKED